MPAGCILWAQVSVSTGYGQPLACAMVPQPVPIGCHFRGCKVLLSRIVSVAILSEQVSYLFPFEVYKPDAFPVAQLKVSKL